MVHRRHYNTTLHMWMYTVLDDRSRKILCGCEFKTEQAKYNIGLFKQAFKMYLHIRPIEICLTNRGSQFYANKQEVFEFQKLLSKLNVNHSKCRYKHPQTNGKFEKQNHTYELHRPKSNSFNELLDWYNNRPHGSLDFDTPKQVFRRELMPWTLENFIKMIEGDLSGK